MRRPLRAYLAIAGIALTLEIVTGCSIVPSGKVIEGWEIGAPVACEDRWCDALVGAAARYLDRTDEDHAPIIDSVLHEWPPARDRAYSGGPPRVVVLRLGDGSIRAIGVKYIGVAGVPSIFAIGPDGEPVVVCSDASCPQ